MEILKGEEVVSAVSTNIRTLFSKQEISNIYKNTPIQNANKPYAFIHQINQEYTNELRGRGQKDYLIDVRVHPEDKRTDVMEWGRKLGCKMLDAINKITISGQQVKARSVSWKVEDSVLHVIASYGFKVVEAALSSTLMDKLYINGVHTQSPEVVDSGEYFEGTLLDIDTGTIQLGDIVIDGQRVDMSLLARNTIIWDSVENGDTLVVLKSGDKYLVLDALNKDRLRPSIDGGMF